MPTDATAPTPAAPPTPAPAPADGPQPTQPPAEVATHGLTPEQRVARAVAALEARDKAAAAAAPPAPADQPGGQPAGAPAPEATPPPAPPAPDPAEGGLARLAAREKELRAIQAEVKAEQEALAQARAKVEAWERTRENAAADPGAFLEGAGLSFEDLQNWVLNGKKATPDLTARATLKTVQQQLEELRQARKDAEVKAQEQQRQAELAEARAQAQRTVEGAKDRYELLSRSPRAADIILWHMQQLQREGRDASWEAAAARAEQTLEEDLAPLLTAEKIKKKLTPSPAVPPSSKAPGAPAAAPRTLTSSATASVPPRPERPLSAEERRLRAAARISFGE